MKRLLLIITAAIALCCCQREQESDGRQMTTVNFVLGTPSSKRPEVDENLISNCNIMVYDVSGQLVASQYSASGPVTSLSFSCTIGMQYRFYCVCNIGDITANPAFAAESGLAGYQYSVDSYSGIIDSFGAVPMTGCTCLMTISRGMTIAIDLVRCVALVTIRVDESGLENSTMNITGIQLKNAPGKVGLFSSSAIASASERTEGNDSADQAQLGTFNSGDAIGFYMFENDQGELLPGNTSCRTKFFAEGSRYEDICSYIELDGEYDDTASANPRHGHFTYRFYLGGNPTTDFSVLRNHHYHIVLKMNDDGVDEESWRVDSELSDYATAVIVDPHEYYFPAPGRSYTLTATVLPETASQEVVWSSSNESVATVDPGGRVTAVSAGQASIKATATDGSGVFDTCLVTVGGNELPVRIRPNYLGGLGWVLGCGSSVSDFEVIVTYDSGRQMTLSGSEALATIDNTDGEWIISGTTLTAPDHNCVIELALSWQDPVSGRRLTFSSEGEVIPSEDIFTITHQVNVAKKYGDPSDCPLVAGNIVCYCSEDTDLSQLLEFSTDNVLLKEVADGFALIGSATLNGDLNYSITGSFIDDFYNPVSKTVSFMTTVFEWRKHYYSIIINTQVRDHIDASYGSQEPADNIIVTVNLVRSWTANEQIARYFYPASYDQDGNLSQTYFSYTWYRRTVTVQMQDVRDYWFDYDQNGNYLKKGFWYEESKYIYYEPLNN